jgi:RNA polymerase sigma factor (sigma-70 family)
MKNYEDSDYALNKFSNGIVYRFADEIVEVTLADYLAENPHKTEADFLELKELSDNIYLDQAQAENAQTKRNTPFDELDETMLCYAPSPEDLFIGAIDDQEEAEFHAQRLDAMRCALNTLTDAQRRRYLLYHAAGITTREIADREGVEQRTVMDSLELADKKITKYFTNS